MALVNRLIPASRYAVEFAGAAWPQFLRPHVFELAAHRPIREVLLGIYQWTATHPRIKLPVDSYDLEFARIVLDPTVRHSDTGSPRRAVERCSRLVASVSQVERQTTGMDEPRLSTSAPSSRPRSVKSERPRVSPYARDIWD